MDANPGFSENTLQNNSQACLAKDDHQSRTLEARMSGWILPTLRRPEDHSGNESKEIELKPQNWTQ